MSKEEHQERVAFCAGRLGRVATFSYDGNNHLSTIGSHTQLTSVDAPAVNGSSRTTTIGVTAAATDTSITDPDTTIVRLRYALDTLVRINRLGDTTTYVFDGAGTLAETRISMSRTGGSPIVTDYCAGETAGINTCATGLIPTDSAYTYVNGPRQNVNILKAVLNRYGAPTRITDALGNSTVLTYDRAWPGLVSEVHDPLGHIVDAYYNSRANPDSVVDVNGFASRATTSYEYQAGTDWLTEITRPEGDWAAFTVDSATGNRLTAQDARGDSTQVAFHYGASGVTAGLLDSITEPKHDSSTTIGYDAFGNADTTTTPLGDRTITTRDAIGRPTRVATPADDSVATHTFVYDVMSRVTDDTTFGPILPYTLSNGLSADSQPIQRGVLAATHTYDVEGRPTDISTVTTDSLSSVGTGKSYAYDPAGRMTSTWDGSITTMYVRDAAGNPTVTYLPNADTVTQTFDALNRLTARTTVAKTYAREHCGSFGQLGPITGRGGVGCFVVFPYVPNSGTSLVVPAETATFAYDGAGNMTQADNASAQVHRHYTVAGLVAVDSLWIADSAYNLNVGAYVLQYAYDRDGRRSGMKGPVDSTAYAYDVAGALHTLATTRLGTHASLNYDADGRLDSLAIWGSGAGGPGVWENRTYDEDNRILTRERQSATLEYPALVIDTLAYNNRDQLTRVRTSIQGFGSQQTFTMAYDGLGAVQAQEQVRDAWGVTAQEFRPDPYGNVTWSRTTASGVSADDAPRVSTYGVSGALMSRVSVLPPSPTANEYEETFDQGTPGSVGRVDREEQLLTRATDQHYKSQMAARYYYDGSNRLAAMQRYLVTYDPDDTSATPVFAGTWEDYRYDALGRRVYVRAHPNATNPDSTTGVDAVCVTPSPCYSYIETAVWDGSQLLYEHRSPTSSSNTFTSGSVGYLHAGDLDQPLAVILNYDSTLVVTYDWRGLAVSGVGVTGAAGPCIVGRCTYATAVWAGQSQAGVYFDVGPIPPSLIEGTPTWMGTLTANGGSGGGLLYRRNRYYDPTSGQFTQEDPIGLGVGSIYTGLLGGIPSRIPILLERPAGLIRTSARC